MHFLRVKSFKLDKATLLHHNNARIVVVSLSSGKNIKQQYLITDFAN